MNTPAPFFLTGCDRSGTTMLRLILDRHSQVAIPPESFFITDFYARLAAYGDLDDPARRLRLVNDMLAHSRVRGWKLGLDAAALSSEIAGPDCYARLVSALFMAYARREGKTRWGDKTVYYVHWIEELKTLFPEARFIHLVRDGRDVALSLLKLNSGPANVYAAARYWRAAVRAGSRAALDQQRVLEVQYEELVTDPQRQVPRICDFLGLHFEPGMLQIERTGAEKFLPHQAAWFRKVAEGITATSVNKWLTEMSPRQVAIFEDVAGRELRHYGYESPPDLPPVRWRSVRYPLLTIGNLLMKIVDWIQLHMVTERGREVPELLRRNLDGLRRRVTTRKEP